MLTNPNTPIPEVHLLSNGRYHVMVIGGRRRVQPLERPGASPAGARTPPPSRSGVLLLHRRLRQTGAVWSNSFQPTLRAGRQYEAIFTPGRAEFRRQDDQVETHTEIAVSTEDDLEIRRIG